MKIIRYDQQHIAVRFNPAGMWIMGVAFLGFAALAVLILGSQSTLTCIRSDRTCSLEKKSLLKTSSLDIPMEQLQGAQLITVTDSEGSDTYKVALNTTGGSIPLTGYSSSGYNSRRRIVEKINAFLTDASQQRLEVKQDSRILLYIIGAIFAGIGLLLILLISRITVDLDRTKGLATLKRRSLITSSVDEILLGDLTGAEVQGSSGSKGASYRVALVQRSGQRTPLTGYYSSGYQGKQKLAEEINNFLQGRLTAG